MEAQRLSDEASEAPRGPRRRRRRRLAEEGGGGEGVGRDGKEEERRSFTAVREKPPTRLAWRRLSWAPVRLAPYPRVAGDGWSAGARAGGRLEVGRGRRARVQGGVGAGQARVRWCARAAAPRALFPSTVPQVMRTPKDLEMAVFGVANNASG